MTLDALERTLNALLDETNDMPVIELLRSLPFLSTLAKFESEVRGLKTSLGPCIIACDRRFELLVVGLLVDF